MARDEEPEVAADDGAEAAAIRGEVKVERQLLGGQRAVRFSVGRLHGKGWRLDKYLHAICPTISRSLLRRWLEQGCCRVDGAVAGVRAKLHAGARVELLAPVPPPAEGPPPAALRIVHQDPGFLVLDKPAGVLAHQAGRNLTGTLMNQLQDWMAEHGRDPLQARLVNRIDRDTSGLMLASLDLASHNALSEALDTRAMRKEYRAVCHGVPDPVSGSWRDPILEPDGDSIAMRIDPAGKPSHTDYEVLEAAPGGRYALLRVLLHTGRQHQIRIHAAHHGHPLVGDWVYGSPCAELPGQALHAAVLELPHPVDGRRLRLEAPLPPALAALWTALAAGGEVAPVPLAEDQRSRLGLGAEAGRRLPDWLSPEERERVRAELGGGS
jgi:23S rRNA pseudouridine1911/1915/1917 synthase